MMGTFHFSHQVIMPVFERLWNEKLKHSGCAWRIHNLLVESDIQGFRAELIDEWGFVVATGHSGGEGKRKQKKQEKLR